MKAIIDWLAVAVVVLSGGAVALAMLWLNLALVRQVARLAGSIGRRQEEPPSLYNTETGQLSQFR
jgi:hypothetical protein